MVMELLSQWMAMFGYLLLVLQKCCYANGCVFQYTQQPPSFLSCNPYSNTSSSLQLQVTFVCGAQRNDNKKDEWTFDLRWFSNYSITLLDHEIDVRTPSFANVTLLVSSPGQYWCQVFDYTDGGDGHLFERTNVVEVLSWNQYTNFSMCIGNQSVMERKCADLSPSPSATPATSKYLVPNTKILANTITASDSLSEASALLTLLSSRNTIHASTDILDYPALFTPSISTTTVSVESSTEVITLVLGVVMIPLLVLLLMAGITVIVLFFRQKSICKSKLEPTVGPLQEEAASKFYESIYLERQDGFSPQLHADEYELSTSPGFCLHSQTTTAENLCEPLYSNVVKNKVHVSTEEHQKNTKEQQQPAPPTGEYAIVNKSKTSCKSNETSPTVIINAQYSVVKSIPNESQDVLLKVSPTIPPKMYLYEKNFY